MKRQIKIVNPRNKREWVIVDRPDTLKYPIPRGVFMASDNDLDAVKHAMDAFNKQGQESRDTEKQEDEWGADRDRLHDEIWPE